MARKATEPDVIPWLQSYGHIELPPRSRLALAGDDDLTKALDAVRTSVAVDAQQSHERAADAEQKIMRLRSTITSLSGQLEHLTNRLAAAEADLAAERFNREQDLARHFEARLASDALQALWEARWREERRLREEAEASLRVLLGFGDLGQAGETAVTVRREGAAAPRKVAAKRFSARALPARWDDLAAPASLDHLSLCDACSASAKDGITRQLRDEICALQETLQRQVSAHDLQVVRLEADLSVRRNELNRLCSAVDALLLSDLMPSQTWQNSAGEPTGAAGHTSFFDHPSVAAAARHSTSRDLSALPLPLASHSFDTVARDIDALPLDVARTLQLENEVRDLERQIATLEGGYADGDPGVLQSALRSKTDASCAATDAPPAVSPAVRRPVPIRPIQHSLQEEPETPHSTEIRRLRGRIFELESACQKLADLLAEAENECSSLKGDLSAKDRALDVLSRRVHDKLVNQREQLATALDRIRFLERQTTQHERERHPAGERPNETEPLLQRQSPAASTPPQMAWSSGEDGTGAARSID